MSSHLASLAFTRRLQKNKTLAQIVTRAFPDLSTRGFRPWGFLKGTVYKDNSHTLTETTDRKVSRSAYEHDYSRTETHCYAERSLSFEDCVNFKE